MWLEKKLYGEEKVSDGATDSTIAGAESESSESPALSRNRMKWLILEIEPWELVLFHTDLLHFGTGYPLDHNYDGPLQHYRGHWYFVGTRVRSKSGRVNFLAETTKVVS